MLTSNVQQVCALQRGLGVGGELAEQQLPAWRAWRCEMAAVDPGDRPEQTCNVKGTL